MAERLFLLALRRRAGQRVDEFYLSHGAGTGSWHVGEAMNAPAARQLTVRGGDATGFRARRVNAAMIDTSDLVLCATSEQVAYVLELRPDAAAKIFVLGEFGRLLAQLDLNVLPPAGETAAQAYDRGLALVAAVDAARGAEPSHHSDDLRDPWGMADREFASVADEIERTVVPLAAALTG